jgi:cytochrome b
MASHKPTTAEMTALLAFHATLSGAFIVAYLTGDEDTYGMHVFSGYAALIAIALRLVAGMLASEGSPLRLPRPTGRPVLEWVKRLIGGDPKARCERSPLIAWMATALLLGVGLAAASGAIADFLVAIEDLHEALGEVSLYIVFTHIALVFGLHGLKRLKPATPSSWTTQRSALSDRVIP